MTAPPDLAHPARFDRAPAAIAPAGGTGAGTMRAPEGTRGAATDHGTSHSHSKGDLVEAAEFDAFYAGSVRRLVGQLYAMTGNAAEAQDVVQEAFVRAWDRRAQLAGVDNPEAWVRTVAYRLAVSRWRKARNMAVAWRRHGPPPDVAGPEVDNPALVAALRLLPEEQRRAIVLHHLCDLSVEQVAAETGAPTGTVKARLSRGRAALARHLTDAGEGRPTPVRTTAPDAAPRRAALTLEDPDA
jgi:RNA polymerase sigma-70 factor (ECF subfamily)